MRDSVLAMKLFFSLILLLLAIQLHATELPKHPYYKEINHYFGLPTMHIYDLHVAKSGLLFLGTDNGLYSYDGIKFKSYRFKNNLANAVDRIQEDESGRIWCKNFSNQVFVLLGDELWVHEPTRILLEKLGLNLGDYQITPVGLWLMTEKDVYLFDEQGKAHWRYKSNNNQSFIFTLDYDPKSKSILVTESDYFLTIPAQGPITKTPLESGHKTLYIVNDMILYAMKGDQNKLFISKDQKNFKPIAVDVKNYIIKTTSTGMGTWLCTGNGIYNIDTENERIEFPFLLGRKVTDVVQDHEGNLWFSTLGDGLVFVPSLKIQKINIDTPLKTRTKFTKIALAENGHLFIGTMTGEIYELDKSYKIVRTFSTGKNKEIEHLVVTPDHVLTSDGRFNRKGNKEPDKIDYYKEFAEDGHGNYLFGSFNIAGIISKGSQKNANFQGYFDNKPNVQYGKINKNIVILSNKRTRAVHYHHQNDMYYVGASDGLFVYGKNNYETEIRTKQGEAIIASSIKADKFGNIWVGSLQNGVFKIKNNTVIGKFNMNNGLSGDNTKKVYIDASGIWIMSDKGLDFINPENNAISRMSRYSGLHGLDFYDITSSKTNLWLISSEGILLIEKSVFILPKKPNCQIENVTANDLTINRNVSLKYNENNILFNLRSIHFKSLGNFHYEYRLLGHSENWKSQASNTTQVNYLSLKPGNYTFEARVRIGDIVSEVQQFQFTIKKAFWMTTWFISVLILLIGSLFYSFFRWQLRTIHKRQQIKEQLALSQITALRTQMNPHFMFNILNAFQGLIYSNQKTKANEYLGTFSDLMRKTLDISDKREISIAAELEAIDLYISLEKARFAEDEFEYTLDAKDSEELKKHAIPSLILQPFIENAIKHGLMHKVGLKKLKLSIAKENNQYWRFEIEDNGIGREQSYEMNKQLKKHISFATKAIDSRINLINRLNKTQIKIEILDLINEQNQAAGTKVILRIPIKPI